MSNIAQVVADDVKKVLEESQRLESKNRSLESQLSAKRLELREAEAEIAALAKRKKSIEDEVARERQEIIARIDRRNSESEGIARNAAQEREVLVSERRKFQEGLEAFAKEKAEILKAEKVILDKFVKIQSILKD